MITTNTDGNAFSAAFDAAMAEPSVSYSLKLYSGGSDLGAVVKRLSIDFGAVTLGADTDTFDPCPLLVAQMEAELWGAAGQLLGEELEVRVGVDVDGAGTYEYAAVAYITVTSEKEWAGMTEIKGAGRMSRLASTSLGVAAGDYTPSAVCSAISTATGLAVTLGTFAGTPTVTVEDGMTCRDALLATCRRLGGYACELGGGISVLPHSSTATCTLDPMFVTGRPEIGAEYEVDGLTVTAQDASYEYGTGRVGIQDAHATATTSALTWGNLGGFAYTPATLSVACMDPRLTVADVVSLTLDGDTHTIPAHGLSCTFDGGWFGTVTAQGIAAEAEDALVQGPLTTRLGSVEVLAAEAADVAEATNQHFWSRSTDPDADGAGTGAFVTDEEQEGFLAAIAAGTEPTTTRPLHNLLMNAEGILLRAAKRIRAAFTPSGVAFYDGEGNEAENVNAAFGADGFQVGREDESHLVGDYHSLQLVDKEGNAYLHVSDLRGQDGLSTVEETVTKDNASQYVTVSYTIDSVVSVTIGGSSVSYTFFYNKRITLSQSYSAGTVLEVTYKTASADLKAFTFGKRASGSVVGPWSASIGGQNTSSGASSVALNAGNTASGEQSLAEGRGCVSDGSASHAEGFFTECSGQGSHSEGSHTVASGLASHAQNYGTIAAQGSQTALGNYNIEDTVVGGKYAVIIGNGTDDNNRSNALTVDWQGNVECGTVNGVGMADVVVDSDLDSYWNLGGAAELIPSGADLDDYTTAGVYYRSYNAEAQGLSNIPTADVHAFKLVVEYIVGQNNLMQTLTEYDYGRQYQWRRTRVSGSTWSAWYCTPPGSSSAATANRVLATPDGSAGLPSYRALVNDDLPTIGASKVDGLGTVVSDSDSDVSAATSATTNVSQVTLAAGTWVVSYAAKFATNATGRRLITLATTATYGTNTSTRGESRAAASGGATTLARTAIVTPTSSTTYYLNVWHNAGAALNVDGSIQAVRIA